MDAVFQLDGRAYNMIVPADGIKRSFQVLDGDNAGRTLSGIMSRDIIGTYYNYSLTVQPHGNDPAEYDAFYEAISAPVDSHSLRFPYGQSTLTFQAYITSGEDTLQFQENGQNYWGGLTINFIAMGPQRT